MPCIHLGSSRSFLLVSAGPERVVYTPFPPRQLMFVGARYLDILSPKTSTSTTSWSGSASAVLAFDSAGSARSADPLPSLRLRACRGCAPSSSSVAAFSSSRPRSAIASSRFRISSSGPRHGSVPSAGAALCQSVRQRAGTLSLVAPSCISRAARPLSALADASSPYLCRPASRPT